MPVSFSEAWEYGTVDPEIEDLMAGPRVPVVDQLDMPRSLDSQFQFRRVSGRPKKAKTPARRIKPTPCKSCGVVFRPKRSARSLYCSNACGGKRADLAVVVATAAPCLRCGTPVSLSMDGRGGSTKKYCTRRCTILAAKARHRAARKCSAVTCVVQS